MERPIPTRPEPHTYGVETAATMLGISTRAGLPARAWRRASEHQARTSRRRAPRRAPAAHEWGAWLGRGHAPPLSAASREIDAMRSAAIRDRKTRGQRNKTCGYLGLDGEHPQRDSNPCRHLERAVRAVHTVSDQALRAVESVSRPGVSRRLLTN